MAVVLDVLDAALVGAAVPVIGAVFMERPVPPASTCNMQHVEFPHTKELPTSGLEADFAIFFMLITYQDPSCTYDQATQLFYADDMVLRDFPITLSQWLSESSH